jgi:hypothetical protein
MVEAILCLAGTAAATGRSLRAARLAGAAEHHIEALEHNTEDGARYRAVIENAKAACDSETWERGWTDGRAMSLDEAADYALSAADRV